MSQIFERKNYLNCLFLNTIRIVFMKLLQMKNTVQQPVSRDREKRIARVMDTIMKIIRFVWKINFVKYIFFKSVICVKKICVWYNLNLMASSTLNRDSNAIVRWVNGGMPRSYLSIRSMLLSPGGHDKSIIDRDAGDLIDAFTLQVCSLFHKTREVSLNERAWKHSEAQTVVVKPLAAQRNNEDSTLEQPGVKAPGTAKRTPVLPLKSSSIDTLVPGSPSWTCTTGSFWPTCGRKTAGF